MSSSNIQSGWIKSGLHPLSADVMLASCPKFHDLKDKQLVLNIKEKLNELVEEVKITKSCSDSQIAERFEELGFSSPIQNMDYLCLNRRRAIILGAESTIQIRAELINANKQKKTKTLAAANKRALNKRSLEDIAAKVVQPIDGPPPPNIQHECGLCLTDFYHSNDQNTIDGLVWKKCSTCKENTKWFCGKKKCYTSLLTHQALCYAKSLKIK